MGKVQIGSKSIVVEVNLKNPTNNPYGIFVHVLDSNSWEILRILDFTPSPPFQQMNVNKTYKLSSALIEAIPEGTIIEIGIYNPSEINLPRLSTHSGETSLMLHYPPKQGD